MSELGLGPAGENGQANRQARGQGQFRRGDTIGRYVLLDAAGSGGMGVVYAAYDPELDRKVAIKLLHRGAAGAQERLLREAQALARLDHANVLTVYDVGLVEGRVFLATAFVAGRTLDRWLREMQPNRQQILEVFQQAGQGLAAAHRAGLVHRDVKPSNIMVGDDGRVLVVDFGLALLRAEADESVSDGAPVTAPELRSKRRLTQAGTLLGTPGYIAPEQLAGSEAGRPSDQFSFCLTLYEALYGVSPFTATGNPGIRALTDWQVREPPPGRRLPAGLRQALLRGLAVDPRHRFESMEALLEALERPTVRRRRNGLLLALAVLLAVAAGWGYQHSQSRRQALCAGGEAAAAAVWNPARENRLAAAFSRSGEPFAAAVWATTRKTLDRWSQDWVAAHREACEATTLRGEQSTELLDRRMACLDQRLSELGAFLDSLDPPSAALISRAADAATGLSRIGDCADTESLLATLPPPRSDQVEAIDQLATELASGRVHILTGTFEAGADYAAELVAQARELGYRPLIADALLLQARLQGVLFRHEQAAESLDQALEAAAAGRHLRTTAEILIERIQLAASSGDLELGLRSVGDASALIDSLMNRQPLALALAKSRVLLLREKGDLALARSAADEALALALELRGEDSLDEAWIRTLVGDLEAARGNLASARQHHLAALRITESRLGPNHPNVALALDRLGQIAAQAGDFADALEAHQRALEIRQLTAADGAVEIAVSLLHVGGAENGLGYQEQAKQRLEQATRAFEAALGPEHPYVAVALINTAVVLVELGREAESVDLYRRALAIREAVYGPEHSEVAQVAFNLGVALRKGGAPAAGLAELRRAEGIWQQTLAADHPLRGATLTAIGECLLDLGRASEALALLTEGLAISEAAETSPDLLGISQFALARALAALGREPERALELAQRARQQFLRVPGISRRELRAVETWLDRQQVKSE